MSGVGTDASREPLPDPVTLPNHVFAVPMRPRDTEVIFGSVDECYSLIERGSANVGHLRPGVDC